MKKITRMFGDREALPVRAAPLVTDWCVTPQELALELSKPAGVMGLTAYRHWNGQAIPVRADAWSTQHEMLIDIVRAFKRDEQEPDQHRQRARRRSLKGLPAGVFVWLDEFENWYSSTYISHNSVWEQQHRVIGEDDDPEPQFFPKRNDALDLFPISLSDFESLISEGFETGASPVFASAASPTAVVTERAPDGEEPDAGQLAASPPQDIAPSPAPEMAIGASQPQPQPHDMTFSPAPVVDESPSGGVVLPTRPNLNKTTKTLEFEKEVNSLMTRFWNERKINTSPTKGELHELVYQEMLRGPIRGASGKINMSMVRDTAKQWKQPIVLSTHIPDSKFSKRRHPFKGEK